jgi:3-hydroxybutyryl-CoA dehydrogenase
VDEDVFGNSVRPQFINDLLTSLVSVPEWLLGSVTVADECVATHAFYKKSIPGGFSMAIAKGENAGWARLAESARPSELTIPQVSMFADAPTVAPEPILEEPAASPFQGEPEPAPIGLPERPELSIRPPASRTEPLERARPSPPAPLPEAPARATVTDRLTVGVIGCGTMGRGVAQLAAAAGHPVLLFDADPRAVETAVQTIGNLFRRAVERGQVPFNVADAAIARVKGVPDVTALAPAELVIEAIAEDIELKRTVFTRLEPMMREDAILATSTSSLSVAAIARGCKRPERFAGLHFFNPISVTRVVEVVRAPRTAQSTIDRLIGIVERLGQTPIVVEDTPGFVVNASSRALFGEALRILEEGVAPAHAIDSVVRDVLGFRSGPFEMLDQIGLDNAWVTQQQLFEQFFGEPRLRPVPLVAQRIAAGLLGRKSNEGFYKYKDGEVVRPALAAPPGDPQRPIWVSGARPQLATKVTSALGGVIETAAGPNSPSNTVILVTPLGLDATQAATEEKLDPRRVVAVDSLFALDRHVVIMGTPATDRSAIDAVHAAFSRAQRQVTVIADSPGFIAQRVAAMIVAIGVAMAERSIAAPADIDRGVTMALGFPLGPLALGDRLGPRVVVEILQNLWRTSGDPRWRIPGWLRRRALIGMPLVGTAA